MRSLPDKTISIPSLFKDICHNEENEEKVVTVAVSPSPVAASATSHQDDLSNGPPEIWVDKATEKETRDSAENIISPQISIPDQRNEKNTQPAIFGPWMMVQRQQRNRNGSSFKSQTNPSHANIMGTRYDALTDLNENDSQEYDVTIMNDKKSDEVKVDTGPSHMHKPVNRIRNPAGGRNPQVKGSKKSHTSTPLRKGPAKPSSSNDKTFTKQGVSTNEMPPKTITSSDPPRNNKGKEKAILYDMMVLQKMGSSFIDNFSTKVFLPNKEVIDFVQRNMSKLYSENTAQKPPDIDMKIDSQNGTGSSLECVADQPRNKDLQDQPLNSHQ
ncbi:hypothetical protein RIF29_25124 [Crotalaria pallida]|uniref:Uncharacterized protein n=1 Tax=Crotalaria pallida TaxID=3830 RepID=A0AAN9ER08_CROPI